MSDAVRLLIAANEPEAEIVCQLLRTEGIECYHRVTNVTAGAFDGVVGSSGFREVLVAAEHLDEARLLLAAQAEPE